MQMRTMRIGLAHFLYKIKASEGDRCGRAEGSQTPKHVLLQCSLRTEERKRMFNKIAARGIQINQTDYDALMSDPQAIRYVAEFMLRTGVLGQFQHVELDPRPETTRKTMTR
ncbi:hypothetical protein EYZ11_006831 [Aspergillus tanneri]|uniref:Uncharacterized protein n=1 Tax=Aspergillus tanneri TaxID=1220188 RepID=A0A4S3JGR0_9EURO|nr:hypothetical protein EYZ11_006831 [Aspergillus tanneri]